MKNLAILECNVETLLYEKKKRFKPFIIKARALFMDKTIGKFNSLTLLIVLLKSLNTDASMHATHN